MATQYPQQFTVLTQPALTRNPLLLQQEIQRRLWLHAVEKPAMQFAPQEQIPS